MERSDKEEEERRQEEDEADDDGEGNDIVSQLFNYDLYEALQIVFLRFPSTADSSHLLLLKRCHSICDISKILVGC